MTTSIFRPLSWDDKQKVEHYRSTFASCQFNHCFETFWLWQDTGEFWLTEAGGFLLIKARFDGHTFFLNPIGQGDWQEALSVMKNESKREGFEFQILKLPQERIDQLEALFPDRFQFIPVREDFEYLYLSERLATLTGKKLQSKRNHINAFEKEGQWRYEIIDSSNISLCHHLLQIWNENQTTDDSLAQDNRALLRALNDYDRLALQGGLLFQNDAPVAFTIGCRLCVEVFYVLFERAYSSVRGAYQMINREFVRHHALPYTYVNRAEDCGDPSLRKAKLSYVPDILLCLYTAKEI